MGLRVRDRREYIHNIARTMQGQLGILPGFFEAGWPTERICATIVEMHLSAIMSAFNKLTYETTGQIAMCGLGHEDPNWPDSTSIYTAMGETGRVFFGDPRNSGQSQVFTIAYYAVIAAMADNIRNDLQKPKDRGRDKASMLARKSPQRVVPDRTHGG